ncbi:hypothetical protein RDABS01_019982 [Bienertia sinuspersici]
MKPVRASRNGPILSNLFFANDIILITEAEPSQAMVINECVCDAIDKRTRHFVWGGCEDHNKIHLILWENVQRPYSQGGLGIRSARQSNAAFLTKLGWRVLTEPNALCSRVLRAKYCSGGCNINLFTPKKGSSNVWSGIVENARVLCEGAKMAIGNGCQTLFWDHSWGESKCHFSIRSDMKIIHRGEEGGENDVWDGVLHIVVQQRIHMFMWRSLHDRNLPSLATNFPLARHVWQGVGGSAHRFLFFQGSLNEWLKCNIKVKGEDFEDDWSAKFTITLWTNPIEVGNIRQQREIFVHWQAPPTRWVLLNYDGVAKGSPAEFMALTQGLELARQANNSKLLVQLDSLTCTQILRENHYNGGECVHIISNCKQLMMLEDWEVRVEHCYREGNKAIDWLANVGLTNPLNI